MRAVPEFGEAVNIEFLRESMPDFMKHLASKRAIYHSEADFQHAFAWEIQCLFPKTEIRLERAVKVNGRSLHLDLLITDSSSMAIELKYKTRTLSVDLEGEEFRLASHGAQDSGRYDFIKDICRLERIVSERPDCEGWAILLTNDSLYWNEPPATRSTSDRAFRLHEGCVLRDKLGWTGNPAPGAIRNREKEHQLAGEYTLCWNDYGERIDASNGRFRFLGVHIPKPLPVESAAFA